LAVLFFLKNPAEALQSKNNCIFLKIIVFFLQNQIHSYILKKRGAIKNCASPKPNNFLEKCGGTVCNGV
jgi:hypothetical protein